MLPQRGSIFDPPIEGLVKATYRRLSCQEGADLVNANLHVSPITRMINGCFQILRSGGEIVNEGQISICPRWMRLTFTLSLQSGASRRK